MKHHVLTATLAGLTLLAPLGASASSPDEGWTYSLVPYLWLPSLDAELNTPVSPSGGSSSDTANVSVDDSDILGNLDAGFMLTGTASKGRWIIGTDVMYVGLSSDHGVLKSVDLNLGSGPINVATASVSGDVNVELDAWVWTMLGGYALVQQPRASLAILGGFRYLGMEVETNWNLAADITGTGPGGATATLARSGSSKISEDYWTAIVALGGRVALGESNWYANGYVDVGSGSSVFTWQGAAGIGYAFGWGDVVLDYRYLYYSQDDEAIDNLSLGGLALGAVFRF